MKLIKVIIIILIMCTGIFALSASVTNNFTDFKSMSIVWYIVSPIELIIDTYFSVTIIYIFIKWFDSKLKNEGGTV